MKIFVAGLSRSGKTTRSLNAAEQVPEVEYVSVSRLLRAEGGKMPVHTLAEGLTNQRTAVRALRAHPLSRRHQIVDGHAMIETLEGPLLVPDWFFDDVKPDFLIYVCDRPDRILARRLPSEASKSILEIAALDSLERAACKRISVKLNIPLLALQAPTLDKFRRAVEQALFLDQ